MMVVAGCGGSSPGAGPAPPASSMRSDPALEAVLLTAQDIGGDVEPGPVPDSQPLPCARAGSGTLDEQSPPALQASAVLLSQSRRWQVGERISTYGNPYAASAALAVFVEGLGCPTATLRADDGTPYTLSIAGPSDVSAQVAAPEVDSVAGWELATPQFGGLAIAAQDGAALLFLTFSSPIDADPAGYPDPYQVAQVALAKLGNS